MPGLLSIHDLQRPHASTLDALCHALVAIRRGFVTSRPPLPQRSRRLGYVKTPQARHNLQSFLMIRRIGQYAENVRKTREKLLHFAEYMLPGEYSCASFHATPTRLRSGTKPSEPRRWLEAKTTILPTDDPPTYGHTGFRGSELFRSSGGKTHIFDYTNGLVMTAFTRGDHFANEIHGRGLFADHVPIPEILETDPESLTMIERMVPEARTLDLLPPDRMEAVAFDYLNRQAAVSTDHSRSSVSGSTSIRALVDGVAQLGGVDTIARGGEAAFPHDVRIPLSPSHGDLWSKNFLINEGGWHLIDWDSSGLSTFLYDAMSWIFTEALSGRTVFAERYLRGVYDAKLIPLFETYQMNYDSSSRAAYLSVYLLEKAVKSQVDLAPGAAMDLVGHQNLLDHLVAKTTTLGEHPC